MEVGGETRMRRSNGSPTKRGRSKEGTHTPKYRSRGDERNNPVTRYMSDETGWGVFFGNFVRLMDSIVTSQFCEIKEMHKGGCYMAQ